ncbi:MAG TPA: hypothetical protein VF619_01030, partial [Allosphingosinicella sp.]
MAGYAFAPELNLRGDQMVSARKFAARAALLSLGSGIATAGLLAASPAAAAQAAASPAKMTVPPIAYKGRKLA